MYKQKKYLLSLDNIINLDKWDLYTCYKNVRNGENQDNSHCLHVEFAENLNPVYRMNIDQYLYLVE